MQTRKGIELISADGIQIRNMRGIITGGSDGSEPAVMLNQVTGLTMDNVALETKSGTGTTVQWVLAAKANAQSEGGSANSAVRLQNCTVNGKPVAAADFKLLQGAQAGDVQIKP